jgi:hypothetical protein
MRKASIYDWSTIHLSDFVETASDDEYKELERLFALKDTKKNHKIRERYMKRLDEKMRAKGKKK